MPFAEDSHAIKSLMHKLNNYNNMKVGRQLIFQVLDRNKG